MPVVNGTGTPSPTPSPPTPASLVGSGGLFTRVGRLGGLLDAINLNRGVGVPTHVASIQAQYQSANQDIISNLYSNLSSYQNAAGSFNQPIRTMATDTVVDMINPLDGTLNTALVNLIAQMNNSSQTVQKNTVWGSIAYLPGNTGNPNVVVSLRDVHGGHNELCFAELITATCINDSQFSAGLAGIEPFSIQGQPSIADPLNWLWPEGSGSGTRATVSAINSLGQSGQGGPANWSVNGSFETWSVTANYPANWEIAIGTPGTSVLRATAVGDVYDGLSAIGFVGDGAENTTLRERFSTAGSRQTIPATLFPSMQLAFNLFIKVDVVPAAGVLRIGLSDGSAIINSDAGVPNSLDVDLTAIGTSWTPQAWAFQVPSVLPSAVYLEIKLTTALSAGTKLFLDRVSLDQMTSLYAGGPAISVFSGNVNLTKGDAFIINVYNDYGGAFQNLFERLFSMRSKGVQLPSSNSPSIPDSLIS
jgi:hypothetical protein